MRLTDSQVKEFLASHDDAVRDLALATRNQVLAIFPDAIETAEGNDFGYGFDRGYKGLVFTISLTRAGVNLGVFGGASLEDPAGRLEGTGKVHRHVKIGATSDLDDELRDLLSRALEQRSAQR